MKHVIASIIALSLLAGAPAIAAPAHPDRHGPAAHDGHGSKHAHDDRRHAKHRPHHHVRGERLEHDHRGRHVTDYRRHGLKAPPRGHEWRQVDDQYLLIAVATGVIASVIAATR